MVNVFSFHISWNPFISGDSIEEMASGLGFFVLFCYFVFVLGVGLGFCLVWFCFLTRSYGCVHIVVEMEVGGEKAIALKKLTLKAS